jgi:hypothetical protein
MKKIVSAARIVAILTVIVLAFGLPAFALADELGAQKTARTATTTPAATTEDITAIPDNEVPLSNKSYEYGWALFNLLATVVTAGLAVFLAVGLTLRKLRSEEMGNSLGLSVFAFISAVLAIVLFVGTEPLNVPNTQMLIVDSYSVAHVSVLAVAALCAVLTLKKDVKSIRVK